MSRSIAEVVAPRHLLSSEMPRPAMAKADLRKAETTDWRPIIGRAIERVKELSGLTLKEFADACGHDERQVKRWFTGHERPQLDALYADARLRPLVPIALAEPAGVGVEIATVVTVRRQIA